MRRTLSYDVSCAQTTFVLNPRQHSLVCSRRRHITFVAGNSPTCFRCLTIPLHEGRQPLMLRTFVICNLKKSAAGCSLPINCNSPLLQNDSRLHQMQQTTSVQRHQFLSIDLCEAGSDRLQVMFRPTKKRLGVKGQGCSHFFLFSPSPGIDGYLVLRIIYTSKPFCYLVKIKGVLQTMDKLILLVNSRQQ